MLHKRILSTLFLLPIIAYFIHSGGLLFALIITIVIAFGLYEFFGLLSHQVAFNFSLKLLAGGATLLLILNRLGLSETFLTAAIALLVLGGLLGGLIWDHDDYLQSWALTMVAVFYISWPMSLAIAIRNFPNGLFWIVVALIGIWSCDSAAYAFGRGFGGKLSGNRKFSARWSPKKTWEGFFGGVLACLILTTLVSTWLLELSIWQALLFGLLLGPTAVLGDLVESMLKRRVGVKDSGTLIPGHGGILDRIDSILFGTVMTYFFAQWFVY